MIKEHKVGRILTNREICAVVKKPAIAEAIRLNRLRWFGHVERIEENRIPLPPPKGIEYEFRRKKKAEK
jgi:hypothetical protein